jgi:DNA-binding response OmpR family regulator
MEEDVRQAYKLGANSFLVKPNDLKELVRLMRVIYEYWSRCEGARGARTS